MPNPVTNFRDSFGTDLGNKLITKEYLMSVYPNIAQEIGKAPELWTWGYASLNAATGTNDAINKSTPVTTFSGGANWKQVNSLGYGAGAIKTDGTLWVWGRNGSVELGINATGNRSTPVTTFAGGTNWKYISCGRFYFAAIKTDGTLWTWGYGYGGRLGNGIITSGFRASTPVTTFAGGTNWKQIHTGSSGHMAAIKTDGTLWTWGTNTSAELGINATGSRSTPVTTFAGGANWKQVSCGGNTITAIKTDGTLWTWGNNVSGQLGNASTLTSSTPVTTFAGGTNWKQCGSAFSSNVAIKTDGTLWIWGSSQFGQLGNNTTTDRSTPITTFAGGNNWKQIGGGSATVVVTKTDGTLWIWGRGNGGQLGINATGNRCTPVTTFAGGTNWKQASSGANASTAIRSTDFI